MAKRKSESALDRVNGALPEKPTKGGETVVRDDDLRAVIRAAMKGQEQ